MHEIKKVTTYNKSVHLKVFKTYYPFKHHMIRDTCDSVSEILVMGFPQ